MSGLGNSIEAVIPEENEWIQLDWLVIDFSKEPWQWFWFPDGNYIWIKRTEWKAFMLIINKQAIIFDDQVLFEDIININEMFNKIEISLNKITKTVYTESNWQVERADHSEKLFSTKSYLVIVTIKKTLVKLKFEKNIKTFKKDIEVWIKLFDEIIDRMNNLSINIVLDEEILISPVLENTISQFSNKIQKIKFMLDNINKSRKSHLEALIKLMNIYWIK